MMKYILNKVVYGVKKLISFLKRSFLFYLSSISVVAIIIYAFYIFENPWGESLKYLFERLRLNHFYNLKSEGSEEKSVFLHQNLGAKEQDTFIIHLGYLGDFLSGTLGIFLSFISIIFVILSLVNQNKRQDVEKVESRIFKLIGLLGEIKNSNNLSEESRVFIKKYGSEKDLGLLKNKIDLEVKNFLNFYLIIFQTLKYLEEHEKDISDMIFYQKTVDDQVLGYINIIKAYIEPELLLCLAIYGHSIEEERSLKIKKLFERYNFLENISTLNEKAYFSNVMVTIYCTYSKKTFGNDDFYESIKYFKNYLIGKENINLGESFFKFLAKDGGKWDCKTGKSICDASTSKSIYLSVKENSHQLYELKIINHDFNKSKDLKFILGFDEDGLFNILSDNYHDDSKLIVNKGSIVIKFSPNLTENNYENIHNYDCYSILIRISNEKKIDLEFEEKVAYFKSYN